MPVGRVNSLLFLVVIIGVCSRLLPTFYPALAPLYVLKIANLFNFAHVLYFEKPGLLTTTPPECERLLRVSSEVRGGVISWCHSLDGTQPSIQLSEDQLLRYHVALSYYRQGNEAKAIQTWQEVRNVDVYFANLGHIHYVQEELEDALYFFELSNMVNERIVSGKFAMYSDLCVALRKQGTEQKAIQNCEYAVDIHRSANNLFLLGRALYELDEFKLADEAFEQAIHLGLPTAYMLAWRGRSLEALGNYLQAEVHYYQAIIEEPDYAWGYIFLGDLKWSQGDIDAARLAYEEVYNLSDPLALRVVVERLNRTLP